MTDPAIIAASYAAERNYSHNPDDVIDPSGAVGAWGTAKESTTELVDLSGTGNIATIYGAMPAEGFIQGRRYDGDDDYLRVTSPTLSLTDKITIDCLIYFGALSGNRGIVSAGSGAFELFMSTSKIYMWLNSTLSNSKSISGVSGWHLISCEYDGDFFTPYLDTIGGTPKAKTGDINTVTNVDIGRRLDNLLYLNHIVGYTHIHNTSKTTTERAAFFNTLARLPFWSVNYTDYPDNVTEYTDNLPYSSSIISSGTFKVDDDVLNCVSAGTITYRASYEFDGSEYIKIEIGGVEYAGTGTITQGNTTVSVAQGSNKITIIMGTADTINKVRIQFREEV